MTLERRIMLKFLVRPEFMTKLNKIKSPAWHRLPKNASLEQVFHARMSAGPAADATRRRRFE
jgi:hypothetical protein